MGDPYYQTLPFTLSQDQLDYDYVLLGTNLQACMIAAHLSKVQKKRGLILELEKGYGGDLKTLSLKQLHQFMSTKKLSSQEVAPLLFESVLPQSLMEKNVTEIEMRKQTSKGMRGYNIDLQPKVFCGSSLACEMLKEANMDQYMDFRVFKKVSLILNGRIEEVPLNLKTIMNAQGLSLFQRKDLFKGIHQLVKIYYKYHSVEADNNSTNQFDKDTDVNQQLYTLFLSQKDNLCSKFLMKVLNNKQKLFDMVMYGICGYQYRTPNKYIESQYSSLEMLKRFGRFVKSCGVYSPTPYLYVDNGIGDIPQAYSRISSIFGGIFIIHPKIKITSIEKSEEKGYSITSNLAPDTKIHTKSIQYTDPYYRYINQKLGVETQLLEEKVLRIILLYKRPTDFKHTGPLIIHNFENKLFQNPITTFLFDSESSTTPEDEFILHISTHLQSTNQEDLQPLIQHLIKDYQVLLEVSEPKYVAAYIQTNRHLREYGEHAIRNDWGFDLEGSTETFKEIVGEQKHYFREETVTNVNDEEEGYYEGLLSKLENLKEKKIENENKKEEEEKQREETQTPTPVCETEQKQEENEVPIVNQTLEQPSQNEATEAPSQQTLPETPATNDNP